MRVARVCVEAQNVSICGHGPVVAYMQQPPIPISKHWSRRVCICVHVSVQRPNMFPPMNLLLHAACVPYRGCRISHQSKMWLLGLVCPTHERWKWKLHNRSFHTKYSLHTVSCTWKWKLHNRRVHMNYCLHLVQTSYWSLRIKRLASAQERHTDNAFVE